MKNSFIIRAFNKSTETIYAAIGQAITSVANFITAIILIRSMGFEEFGYFSMFYISMMVLRNVTHTLIMVPYSIVRGKLPEAEAASYRSFSVTLYTAYVFLVSVLTLLVFTVFSFYTSSANEKATVLVFIFSNSLCLFYEFFRRWLLIEEKAKLSLVFDVVRFGLQLVILYVLASLISPFKAGHAFILIGICCVPSVAWGSVRFGLVLQKNTKWSKYWKRHFEYYRWMLPGVLFETVQGNAPFYISGVLLSASDLGVIRAMQSLSNFVNLPYNTFQQSAPSKAAKAYHGGGQQSLTLYLVRVSVVSFFISMISTLFIWAFFDLFFQYAFHERSTDLAYYIFLAYSLLNLVIALKLPFTIYFQVIEQPRPLFAASAVGAVLSLTVSLYFIMSIGSVGVPLTNIFIAIATMSILALRSHIFRTR